MRKLWMSWALMGLVTYLSPCSAQTFENSTGGNHQGDDWILEGLTTDTIIVGGTHTNVNRWIVRGGVALIILDNFSINDSSQIDIQDCDLYFQGNSDVVPTGAPAILSPARNFTPAIDPDTVENPTLTWETIFEQSPNISTPANLANLVYSIRVYLSTDPSTPVFSTLVNYPGTTVSFPSDQTANYTWDINWTNAVVSSPLSRTFAFDALATPVQNPHITKGKNSGCLHSVTPAEPGGANPYLIPIIFAIGLMALLARRFSPTTK